MNRGAIKGRLQWGCMIYCRLFILPTEAREVFFKKERENEKMKAADDKTTAPALRVEGIVKDFVAASPENSLKDDKAASGPGSCPSSVSPEATTPSMKN